MKQVEQSRALTILNRNVNGQRQFNSLLTAFGEITSQINQGWVTPLLIGHLKIPAATLSLYLDDLGLEFPLYTFELLFVKIICLTQDRFSPKLASLLFDFLECLLSLLVDDFSSTLSSLFSVTLR